MIERCGGIGRFVWRVGVAALVVGVVAGCSDKSGDASGSGEVVASGDRVVEYTVRGVLTRLPSAAEPDMLYARHEAIPEYRKIDGSYGMDVMTMPFPLPEGGLSLEGLSVGDPVRLVFAVTYGAEFDSLRGYVLESIERLPAETVLDFTHLEALPGFDRATGRIAPDGGDGSGDGDGGAPE
ncbi:MAG: hypothetical protein ACTS3F_02250 [Phycisphaerales bacterium]